MPDDNEKCTGFVSRTLTNAEKRYKVAIEALAIILDIKNLFLYLQSKRFTLFTISKSIVSIFSSTESILVLSTARMQLYAICLQISQYGTRYTKAIVHENINPLS